MRETERQRGETKRREEKVRGTAQESFSHEAKQHEKTNNENKKKTTTHQSPHTVKRTELSTTPASPLPQLLACDAQKKNDDDSDNTDFKEVTTPPRHMASDSDMHKLHTWHPQGSI